MAKFPAEKIQALRNKSPAETTYPRAFTIYNADLELVKWMAAEFGCSRSEVVRTAIRAMAMRMNAVELVMAAEGKTMEGDP